MGRLEGALSTLGKKVNGACFTSFTTNCIYIQALSPAWLPHCAWETCTGLQERSSWGGGGHLPCGPEATKLQQPTLHGIEILRTGTEGASVSDPAQALPWVVNAWRTSGSLARDYCFLHTMQLFVRMPLSYPSQEAAKHPKPRGNLFWFSCLNMKLMTVPAAMPAKRWTDRNQWLEFPDLRVHPTLPERSGGEMDVCFPGGWCCHPPSC